MTRLAASLAACLVATAVPRAAHADVEPDPDTIRTPRRTHARDIVIDIPGERSQKQKIVLAATAGMAAVVGAIGVYFNLDAIDARDTVGARKPTGLAWTSTQDDLVARADRSGTRAGIAYGIGGAFLIGAIVGYIATDPAGTTKVIHTQALVAPTAHGGAVVGGLWRF